MSPVWRMKKWAAAAGAAAIGVAALGTVVGGCNAAPATVTVRRLAAVPPGEIGRIAVLPFATDELGAKRHGARVGEPAPAPELAQETVARAVSEAMRRFPGWQVVDALASGEAFRRRYGEERVPDAAEAREVGRLLGVDAVLSGRVLEFDERVGAELAVQRPARVAFAVELMSVASGEALWQGEYAETQQALTDNLWNLFGFLRAGARWVRARDLAALGAERVARQLHNAIYGGVATPIPRTAGQATGSAPAVA